MSETKSPLVLVPCPICGCDEVRLANIVKLVPYGGKPNSSYPITIFADNRVVLDENSMPVTDFVGCRLAVGLECADGHLWSLIFLEHLGRLYTTVPVQHSA